MLPFRACDMKYEEKFIKHEKLGHKTDKIKELSYRKLPVAYKDHGSEEWHWADANIEYEHYQDGDVVVETKTLTSIGYYGYLGSMDEYEEDIEAYNKKVIVIPHIECTAITFEPEILDSAETIILNADTENLEIHISEGMRSLNLKNLWVCGAVKFVWCNGYPLKKLRVPYTVDSLRVSNTTDVMGLNELIKADKNNDLLIEME